MFPLGQNPGRLHKFNAARIVAFRHYHTLARLPADACLCTQLWLFENVAEKVMYENCKCIMILCQVRGRGPE